MPTLLGEGKIVFKAVFNRKIEKYLALLIRNKILLELRKNIIIIILVRAKMARGWDDSTSDVQVYPEPSTFLPATSNMIKLIADVCYSHCNKTTSYN